MKIHRITTVIAVLTTSIAAYADENAQFNKGVQTAQADAQFIQGVQAASASADEEKTLQALKDGPGGVQKPISENGILKRIYIVAKIPLPSSMKKATAKSFARNQADLDSKTMFVEWMCANVGVDKSGSLTMMTQDKGNDNGASQEGGEDRTFAKVTKSQAQGQVRGIVGITEAVVDDEYIGIFGWSPNLAKNAAAAQQMNSQGAAVPGQQQAATGGTSGGPSAVQGGRAIQPVEQKKGNASGINDF